MKSTGLVLIGTATLLSACSSQELVQVEDDAPQQTVFELMTQEIDPDADAIWNIGNAALDDQANIDPSRLDAEDWRLLQEAALSLAADSRELAALDPVIVTRPGVTIADEGVEGAPTPAEIQAHIDRDTEVFRGMAEALGIHAAALAAAAEARDAPTAGRLINELDAVCESCHLEFWYPSQKALIEQLESEGL